MSVALLILPDFLLVALGWVLRQRLGFSRDFFNSCERLTYYVLFPALLFSAIMRTPISPKSAVLTFQATALLMLGAIALSWLARWVLKPSSIAMASAAQCGYRFNTYIGLSLALSLGGTAGQTAMALIVGFAVPIANVAAVYGLARNSGGNVLRELARNPLVLATTFALAFNLAGLQMPQPLDIVLSRLGAAAIALGIICVGAALSWEGGHGHGRLLTWMIAVKLVAMPALAWGVAAMLGLPDVERTMLILFASLPTASAAYVLAVRMGGDGRMVAVLISLGTALAMLTMPVWLSLAGHG